MLLNHISITGYKRLANASVYVGRKAVALVGPNEAGKSSVLSALSLFDSTDPVPARSLSRGSSVPDESDVVVLSFMLSDEQTAILAGLPLAIRPQQYRRHKRVSGEIRYSFFPVPAVLPDVELSFVENWPSLRNILESEGAARVISESDDDSISLTDLVDEISGFLDGHEVAEESWEAVRSALQRFKLATGSKKQQKIWQSFEKFYEYGRPGVRLLSLLRTKLKIVEPEFAMFGEEERAIRAEYELNGAATASSVALANLLAVAGVTLAELQAVRDDAALTAHIEQQANERLARFFESRWSQESVTAGLKVDGDTLRVFVKDNKNASIGWFDITDRSDGLRMFLALSTFLARQDFSSPPVLLIDEAEQHLHLNAQADLVGMLQNLDAIQQVIYTTHSPGCLPTDLGNGVRFVEPLADGTSRIRHDFWSLQDDGHVGFNPLLMVMGAGSAAFSSLRSALIVEGASDMLLLPTLIKMATGKYELRYQVSPGISVASSEDISKLDLAASRVAYMVDGDETGQAWLGQLRRAGVHNKRLRALPVGVALEDLLQPQFYVDTLNDLFATHGQSLQLTELGNGPIKSAVSAWAKSRGIPMPGPVAVVEHILGNHESERRFIRLQAAKRRWLLGLDAWAMETLY